jgi:G3E family GTPase
MKLYLVGGFLGSGKTTAIAAAGKILLKEKISVAVITNDQGAQLVDTAFIDSMNIPHGEVRNGCFCCNYEQFHLAIRDLDSSIHPDIIFAEAVGSCTDLVATVVKPLLQFEPGLEIVLSVFADASVLLSSIEGRSSFVSGSIQYLYKKQLQEAGILVINKSDILTEEEVSHTRSILEEEYPGKRLLFQNSMEQGSIKQWLQALNEKAPAGSFLLLDINYEKYAEGEAALAWLDASLVIYSKEKAVNKGFEFVASIHEAILHHHLPLGHLKFFLKSGDWHRKISYTPGNNSREEEDDRNIIADEVTVLINARVETNPDCLEQVIIQTIKNSEDQNCRIEVLNLSAFQPGYPRPVHRLIV